MFEDVYSHNLAKISELKPHIQYACREWLDDCWAAGKHFRITEAFRSQSRQNDLYKIGRTLPGTPVTWTRFSMHTQGLAVDVFPLDCAYFDLVPFAQVYGITHPLPQDQPHFQFDEVPEAHPPVVTLDPQAKIRALERALLRAKEPLATTLRSQLERLQSRLIPSQPIV